MLHQVFIDNYKCLVNFELNLERIALFLGPNGSGKSSVFEVLHKLKGFISGADRITGAFGHETLTSWQRTPVQRFGLSATIEGKTFHYTLEVEHELYKKLCRVKKEALLIDSRPLFELEDGTARLFRDDFSKGPEYPFDWSQSGLSSLQPRRDNQLLTQFKEWISRMIIVQPVPGLMTAESSQEDANLSLTADNFSSWYRYLSQEHQGRVFELVKRLRSTMDGFDSFRLASTGEEHRTLMAGFVERPGEPVFYRFDDLSHGQRIIILLYALYFYVKDHAVCLCVDEPENYLGLPEIQPWLTECFDAATEGQGQVLFISHHPEIINYLATEYGHWFEKAAGSPVRLRRITEDAGGLPVSELVARGWIHE